MLKRNEVRDFSFDTITKQINIRYIERIIVHLVDITHKMISIIGGKNKIFIHNQRRNDGVIQ